MTETINKTRILYQITTVADSRLELVHEISHSIEPDVFYLRRITSPVGKNSIDKIELSFTETEAALLHKTLENISKEHPPQLVEEN